MTTHAHEQAFELALDQALDRLAAGEPRAALLAEFTAHAAELAPLLDTAEMAGQALAAAVPAPDLARGRARFLAAGRVVSSGRRPPAAARWRGALAFAPLRLGLAVLLVVALAAATGAASAGALPGDALYPVKRAFEGLRLSLTAGADARSQYAASLADRRRQEAARILSLSRETDLSFEGRVESVASDLLVVSGLRVRTAQADSFAAGDTVAVEARSTRQGQLVASRVRLLQAAPPALPAAPTRAPSATPPTRAPDATPAVRDPSATPAARATDAGMPATSRATPTAPPASRPTQTPPAPTRPAESSPTLDAPRPAGDPSATPAQRPTESTPARRP